MPQVSGIEVKLDLRKLRMIERGLMPKAQQIIHKTAFDIQENAAKRAKVDTGALRSSFYAITPRSKWRGGPYEALERAMTLRMNPSRHDNRVHPLRPGEAVNPVYPEGELEAIVGSMVKYAYYHEFGIGRVSNPMLTPAREMYAPIFYKAWDELFR